MKYFRLTDFILIMLVFIIIYVPGYAQEDSTKVEDIFKLGIDDMYDRSQEDLLNVKVTIASKKSETLFEAPFSVSVISREEIKKAGATSIMEAFRLLPGLIVIEQSNGNFDIHVRGGGNVQRSTFFSVSGNTTTLVMIDNRPIYNYYLGGTFWETIPIDLNDVDRIELVRGPTSAMYGPNAVSGVINIITSKPADEGIYTIVNAQQGSNNTYINNASLGYKLNKKVSFIFSGNWQQRDRTQTSYYSYFLDSYVEKDQIPVIVADPEVTYPKPELAQRKYGANVFFNYQPGSLVNINIAAGLQDSRVQKTYSENLTSPLTTSLSNSQYIDVKATFHKLYSQFSYITGKQTEDLSAVGQIWDFNAVDGIIEYDINIKNLTIKPGLNFRQVVFDDTPYFNIQNKEGLLNGRRSIQTIAAYLRGDYNLMDNRLRLIAAMRVDQFNHPDRPYLSFQFATNYKINTNNLMRLVFSRANLSANIINTFSERISPTSTPPLLILGNENLELLTNDMAEVGYRARLGENLHLDVEIFHSRGKNYADFINTKERQEEVNGVQTTVQPLEALNTPLKTRQTGITLSLNYAIKNLQIRPFFTYQKTLEVLILLLKI